MVSSDAVPWYNRPAREFPVKKWQRERYGFMLPPLRFAGASQPEGRREFPVKRWLRERQGVGSAGESPQGGLTAASSVGYTAGSAIQSPLVRRKGYAHWS